ncbi:unnamed protein product [Ectocarpus fasciculatus]
MCFPRLIGSTTFRENGAWWGGAIYFTDSVTTFPDDTVFEGNTADAFCPDVHDGDDNNCPVV